MGANVYLDNRYGTAPVSYVGVSGNLTLRTANYDFSAIHDAATSLKAVFIVMMGPTDLASRLPTWEVFRVSQMQRDRVHGWKLPLPVKTFVGADDSAAVMWAVHHCRSS